MIIIQRVTTTWTKADRNADSRETRARLPTAYPLPDDMLIRTSGHLVHCVNRSAVNRYCPHDDWHHSHVPASSPGIPSSQSLLLEEAEGILRLSFRWNDHDCGIPARRSPPDVFVSQGQIVRVRFNGRFVGFEDSWYEEKLINVSYGNILSKSLFTRGDIELAFEAMVDLW